MKKTIKTLFILLATVASTGCRSAKPMTENHSSMSEAELSTDSLTIDCRDSISMDAKSELHASETIRFVETGGIITLESDGTLKAEGVAEIHSSRLRKAETREEFKIEDKRTRSVKTNVSRSEFSDSSTYVQSTRSNVFPKVKMTISAFIILMIIIIVAWIWRNLRK